MFAAILAGLITVILPWFIVIPIALAPIAVMLAFAFPEVGVVALLAAIFGVFPQFILPNIPVAGGSVRPEDLGLIAFLLILMLRKVGEIGGRLAFLKPYLLPLGSLLIVAGFSTLYAFLLKKAPAKDIFNEVRPFYIWLLLPLLPLAIDTEARMKRFVRLLMALALLLAIGMLIQSIAGMHIFQRSQLMGLTTVNETVSGIVRSTTPGGIFMAGAFIYVCADVATRQRMPIWFSIFAGGVLASGLIVGFTRGLWVSVIAGLLLLALYSKHSRYLALIVSLLIIGLGALSVVAVLRPTFVEATTERLLSINQEIKSGSSFGRRKIEIHFAVPKFLNSPMTGVGLGGQYKPHTSEAFGWEGETRYIHNLYVAIATKLGFPGLVCALWFVAVALWRSWRIVSSGSGNVALGFAAFWTLLTSMVFTTLTQPNLMATYGVATVALAIFLMERERVPSSVAVKSPPPKAIASVRLHRA